MVLKFNPTNRKRLVLLTLNSKKDERALRREDEMTARAQCLLGLKFVMLSINYPYKKNARVIATWR